MSLALGLAAPAKLNLGLRVIGRRPDGYHELETVFCAVELADSVVARRREAPGVALTMTSAVEGGLPVSGGDDNLAVRAARAWLAATGIGGGLDLYLHKRIPAGAGLGGGSADAAAVLVLAQELAGGPLAGGSLSDERLAELACSLGADVPFFLAGPFRGGGRCFARGIGERLWTIPPCPSSELVLVLPPFGTSTPAVFRELGARLIEDATARKVRASQAPTATEIAVIEAGGNDLEEPAMRCTPELAALRGRIVGTGPGGVEGSGIHGIKLSGSGSTLFVAHEHAAAADSAARSIRAALTMPPPFHSVRVVRTRTLERALVARPVPWSSDAASPSVSGEDFLGLST